MSQEWILKMLSIRYTIVIELLIEAIALNIVVFYFFFPRELQ